MISRDLVPLFGRHRFPLTSERATQDALAAVLTAAGVEFVREWRLSAAGGQSGQRDIADFGVDGIAIEVKLGGIGRPSGSKREIYRQCRPYCEHPEVRCLILATNLALGLPPLAKPVEIVSLGILVVTSPEPVRFYGQLARKSRGKWIVSDLDPQVALRLKSMFPKLPKRHCRPVGGGAAGSFRRVPAAPAGRAGSGACPRAEGRLMARAC